jgi:hypothetical protein
VSTLVVRRGAARWLVAAALLGLPTHAQADWYLCPFVGVKLGGSTTLIDQELVAGSLGGRAARKWAWGGTATWLGTGILGAEADLALIPGYFAGDGDDLVSSRVTSMTLNIVLAAPLDFTRDSLRPYASGGYGLMRAGSEHVQALSGLDYTRNLSSINLGGGVIGMLSRRTGVRWDARYQRGIGSAEGGGTALGGPARLSFWRATMGAVIRY